MCFTGHRMPALLDHGFLLLVAALTVAAFACRAGGFWVMRYVTVTPRIQAALKAAPIAAMVGVVVPTAVRGGIPELAGLVAVAVSMRLKRNDLLATFIGVIVVALLRWALT